MLWTPPVNGYSTEEAAAVADVTFRQIDHWHRAGHIRPSTSHTRGRNRRWTVRDTFTVWVHGKLWNDVPARTGSETDRLRGDVIEACYSQSGWWLIAHPQVTMFTSDFDRDVPRSSNLGGVVHLLPIAPFADRITGTDPGTFPWENIDPTDILGPATSAPTPLICRREPVH